MAHEFKAITQDELLQLVHEEIRGSIGYSDGDMSNERQEILRYYHGELPERQSNGNSSYVSQDVYDGVEGLKALLLETFSAGTDVIQFAPQNGDDVAKARVCTAYTNYIIHRQNDGFSIYRDVLHDALIARNGVAKVYWDEAEEVIEEEFEDLLPDEIDALLADPEAELSRIEEELEAVQAEHRCLARIEASPGMIL